MSEGLHSNGDEQGAVELERLAADTVSFLKQLQLTDLSGAIPPEGGFQAWAQEHGVAGYPIPSNPVHSGEPDPRRRRFSKGFSLIEIDDEPPGTISPQPPAQQQEGER